MRRIRALALATALAGGIAVAAPVSAVSATPSAGSPAYSVRAAGCNHPVKPGHVHCLAQVRTTASGTTPSVTPATISGYRPADLRSAYKLPSTGGAGRLLAIVDAYDHPKAEQNLATYRSTFGLPPCTTANGCFHKVSQTGSTTALPTADAGWAEEISLDLDMASAICPGCHLLLVEAKDSSFGSLATAVNTAARMGAKAISNSYGGPEWSGENYYAGAYNHSGIAITASSGDAGYGVEVPAAFSTLTAVGGTSLRRAANARGWSEAAWSSAGSGCSRYVTKPARQTDKGCSKRTVADVSAVADPYSGVAVYNTYGGDPGWMVFGGTSASSPIVAAVYALNGTNLNPTAPYAHRSSLFDVTSGSNGSCSVSYLCHAVAGYDGPTGLGTPNGLGAF